MAGTGPDELAVLALVARGLTVTAVARRLEISERTVRRRLRTAADDLGVDSTIEAVVAAVRRQLI
ncbi:MULTISPECIES: LuxR C-terminal-related transcriptional regulator [Nocardioides]|uniref:LuxR C-terminal-related transcriptional regulator n=1 Tax=Nocardioides kribbensis TaxID=305517 RepID=A0ABV1NY55_9ACTN|nr:LuxR C-terminal-related transcriptional regulator [Nocardioides sp. P86]MCM3516767.1 LuxR C-terminal-related transcriptional regulator [Nocardioides sp. P86]